MLRPTSDGLTRRDFLHTTALTAGALGLSACALGAEIGKDDRACIFLFLLGGPSHLDTFDPKPDAPVEVRGPFRTIRTRVPGLGLTEPFPLMARVADRFAVVRSVHHDEAPVHETGHQLVQTGRLSKGGIEHPHVGAVLSHLHGSRNGAPPFVVLGGPIQDTGIPVSHGQEAGYLGSAHSPAEVSTSEISRLVAQEPAPHQERYGHTPFGRACLLARTLVERGTRLVAVNMFDAVYDTLSWDCHADGHCLPTTLLDYRDTICPMFDRAYSALLLDLEERGLLGKTLVVATGEFGRTPKLNARGGRDHWPGCWSALFAGGGVRGGRVIGASDRTGAEPADRPVTPAEIVATVYHGMRMDVRRTLTRPDGVTAPLADTSPITELFGG